MNFPIEPLESRIAPAAVSVTYVDSDGDKVKITASKGPLDLSDLTLSGGATGNLLSLNLTDVGFAGANITFTVTKVAAGDGFANVGLINGTGNDLGIVKVKGDLSRIVAGDGDSTTVALVKLQARSLGVEKLSTTTSSLVGGITTVAIARDVMGARIHTHGPNIIFTDTNARIDALRIGGSLIGEGGQDSGSVQAEGGFRIVSIRGDIIGSAGNFSGRIEANNGLTSLTVGRSIIGSAGNFSGMVAVDGLLGKASIGRDLVGSGGQGTGSLRVDGGIGNVRIGRDLIGGGATESGLVWAKNGDLGKVRVVRNVIGGNATGSASVEKVGTIFAHDSITSVSIGGSLTSGSDLSTGTLKTSGAIVAGKHLGSVTVGGSIVGNATMPVLISAVAMETEPLTGTDFAITRLTVGRSVTYADIKAGFNTNGVADNADASIGPVRVGGGWSFSNLVAGVVDAGTPGFGLGDTRQGVDDNPLTVARIAGITIGGKVTSAGSALYGFVSQRIDFLQIAGKRVAQLAGPSNDGSKLIAGTTNVYLEEVA